MNKENLNKSKKKASQKKEKKLSPRITAILIIQQLLKQQSSLANLIPEYTKNYTPQEKSFIKELCYGCCRWYPQLDLALSKLLKQPLKKKESDIKAILLLGIYQLQFMRIAEHAAINESVNSVSYFKKLWAKKLINAILRSYQRQNHEDNKSDTDTLFYEQVQQELPSAHPQWLEKKIKNAWPKQADNIFAANNQHPPFVLRVNQQINSRDQYLQKLKDNKINAKPANDSVDGIYLDDPRAVDELPQFFQGAVSVQDEAAQLASGLLKLKPGLRVLDACAAPGGKTCHIGETEANLELLIALDIEQRRLQKVNENIERLGINAKVVCGDGAQPSSWWDGHLFDRILLDAPCSATGIIRRQPDIKLLRQPEHIASLVQIQIKLLKALWPLLKEGGILLYATCSILPEENTEIIERFIDSHDDASHDLIEETWGLDQAFGRQLLPVDSSIAGSGHDGFYYARLIKQKS